MAVIPVVPLATGTVSLAGPGFSDPESLQKHGPSEWQPTVLGLRPASYPTMLARERATEFALRNLGKLEAGSLASTLVEGSTLLLMGLLSGSLSLRWLQVSALRDCPLRHALSAEAGLRFGSGSSQRLGLIEAKDGPSGRHFGVTWGYFGSSNVPVLAGVQHGSISQLRTLATTGHGRKIAWLLNQYREPRRAANAWTHNLPWMALVDSAMRHAGVLKADSQPTETPVFFADDAVAISEDVRSLGPFQFPGAPGGSAGEDAHWLAHSPGFVTRLAQVLTTAATVNDRQRTITFGPQGSLAVLNSRTGLSDADFVALGGGNVLGGLEQAPPDTNLAALATANVIAANGSASGFNAYLRSMQTNLTSLVKASTEAPWRLTDLARAVAKHAPQVVGEAAAAQVSPRARAVAGANGGVPTDERLAALRKDGDAFLLTPAERGATATPMLFLERSRPNDVIGAFDLSLLGTALWMAFVSVSDEPTKVECHRGEWFVLGKSVDDPLMFGSDDWPCELHKVVERWWESEGGGGSDGNRGATVKKLATLQRFAAAYGAGKTDSPTVSEGPAEELAKAAVRAFLRRLSGSRVPAGLLEACGNFETPTLGQFDLGDDAIYGRLSIRVDPFRSQP